MKEKIIKALKFLYMLVSNLYFGISCVIIGMLIATFWSGFLCWMPLAVTSYDRFVVNALRSKNRSWWLW